MIASNTLGKTTVPIHNSSEHQKGARAELRVNNLLHMVLFCRSEFFTEQQD